MLRRIGEGERGALEPIAPTLPPLSLCVSSLRPYAISSRRTLARELFFHRLGPPRGRAPHQSKYT